MQTRAYEEAAAVLMRIESARLRAVLKMATISRTISQACVMQLGFVRRSVRRVWCSFDSSDDQSGVCDAIGIRQTISQACVVQF